MKTFSYPARISVATVSFTVLKAITDILSSTAPNLSSFAWLLVSNFLVISILSYIIVHSHWAGIQLILAVFLFYFGVSHFNTLIEAIFFHLQIAQQELTRIVINGLFDAVALSVLLVLIWEKMRMPPITQPPASQQRNPVEWLWRIFVSVVSYVILYFIAGATIYPLVKEFYSARSVPTLPQVLSMQVFRGLVYVALSLLIVRMMTGQRLKIAISLGLALSIVGGIAPLLLPNPYMPSNIRLIHGFEIGISNFLFGSILGFLLPPRDAVNAHNGT